MEQTTEIALPESKLTNIQQKTFGSKSLMWDGVKANIVAEVRHDDRCGNGHNTFTITADITRRSGFLAGGCLHEDVAQHFPNLAPLIKWHLCSTDGPMHYPGNVLYRAGERDCWGKLKGEPNTFETHVQFGDNPIKHRIKAAFGEFLQEDKSGFDFEVIAHHHHDREPQTKYTFGGYADRWHECPFSREQEALDFLAALRTCNPKFVSVATSFGEGKARELDAARAAAIWPEATDEELTAPDLRERLMARLPKLMEDFKAAVESLGFVY